MGIMPERDVTLIGAAFGKACAFPRTAEAPDTLLAAGLLDRLKVFCPHIHAAGIIREDESLIPSYPKHTDLHHHDAVLAFQDRFYQAMKAVYARDTRSIVLGGDHSISSGNVAALSQAIRGESSQEASCGLLWIDAHADINTEETTPSGNIHGMTVAALLGLVSSELHAIGGPEAKIKAEHLVFVGLRDLDEGEKVLIREKNIKAFTMTDIDRMGIGAVMNEALEHLQKRTQGYACSFDLDVCDPALTTAVGTPVRGGLTYRESHFVLESVAKDSLCRSIEFVEFNPGLDDSGASLELSMALLESAAGKSIL